ncbi:HEAT repeat domain-containing protein [Kribbella sp. NPDC059898]|uniref:HEAT repeat domain-containing protein n=1 Tax=Kribbella sp. NPDC059898 TaxID=3346995 RepID=UPI00364D1757
MVDVTDLLAGLDNIEWAELNHAYGDATDVPADLRAACSADQAAREKAFSNLFASIFHQGTRYSASPHAVPFLARIAIAGPPEARVDALWLLTRLAVDWHDEYDLPMGIDTVAWRAAAQPPEETVRWCDDQLTTETSDAKRRELEELREWAAAGNPVDGREGALRSYDAVRREIPSLLSLLDDPDAAVRTRTAYLLNWFPEEREAIVPALGACVTVEQNPVVKATALIGLGLLGANEWTGDLQDQLEAPDPLIRWAAATALVRAGAGPNSDRSAPSRDTVTRAFTALADFAAGPRPEAHTDHNEGNPHAYTGRTLLLLLNSVPNDDLLGAIANCLRYTDVWQCDTLAAEVITKTFDVQGIDPSPMFVDLSRGQQQIILALADHPVITTFDRYAIYRLAETLQAAGLPKIGQGIRGYAGLPMNLPDLITDETWLF